MRKLRNLINETEAHQPLLIPCIILKDLEHYSYQKCLELLFNISQKNLSASENCLSYLVNRMLCDVTPEAEIKLKLKVYSFG